MVGLAHQRGHMFFKYRSLGKTIVLYEIGIMDYNKINAQKYILAGILNILQQ